MSSSSSTLRKKDTRERDRISNLPSNIIECILDRLPIRDAVATSVLSKGWKHKWRRVGNLVFDDEFSYCVNRRFSTIISNILLLHLGPIQKFVLHVPWYIPGLPDDDLTSTMLFVSENKVKELVIKDLDANPFRLPSYIFHCTQLRHLELVARKLYINPPNCFKGFGYLLSLDLSGSLDGEALSSLISSCPLLEKLSIRVDILENALIIDAPRLRELSACASCPSFESLKMKNAFSVTKLAIAVRCFHLSDDSIKDLMNIFASAPKVETLTLSATDYAMLPPNGAPTSLPTTLYSIRSLTLLYVSLPSRVDISFLFCIIKSAPNLQKLNLGLLNKGLLYNEHDVHFLDKQIRKPQTLDNLITVKIRGLEGGQMEITFIKLILSCSPVLNTIYLAGVYCSLDEEEFTLITELLQCPRSSSKARVVYSRFGDRSIFNF